MNIGLTTKRILTSLLFPLLIGWAQVTGLREDFNDNLLTGWEVPAAHQVTYQIAETDSMLVIAYHRTVASGEWDVINFTPPGLIDISEFAFISIRAKSDIKTELVLKPKYENSGDDWLELQLPADNTWHSYFFELEAAPPLVMNRMYLYLDGGTSAIKSGTICLDDFCAGDQVDTSYVDVSLLETAITAAMALYSNSVEGDGEGWFQSGSKAAFLTAIHAAQGLIGSDSLTPEKVEKATLSLYDACVTFETQVNTIDVGIIDRIATCETRYLYANLKKLAPDYLIFGMHDVTGYGVGWSGDDDRSDVKDVCGSYPALYSEDMNKITRGIDVDRVRYRVTSAYNRGGITTFSWHQIDPLGRGFNASDVNHENIVATLIPGGKYHEVYKEKLRTIAIFLKSLRGLNGQNVPIIFRPYHEHTGGWFWWGAGECSIDQYNSIWQFTVGFLRDSLNVHNVLYALSPAGQHVNRKEDYYNIFPGVDYVDIFGVDDYFSDNITEFEKHEFQKTLCYCVEAARDHDKVAALTETGQENLPTSNFFTDALLEPIKTDTIAMKISYAAVWRNSYELHHFAPYPGHPTVPDFLKFYHDPFTLFEDNLPDMYRLTTADSASPVFVGYPGEYFVAFDTTITLSVTTNERAFLRYSVADESYEMMQSEFQNGQGTLYHSTEVTGRQGGEYRFYVRAADYAGNISAAPLVIDFRIDTLQKPVQWFDNRYAVADWPQAAAPFVFQGEQGGATTIIPARTSYFRNTFSVENAGAQKQLIVFVNCDNGFVLYLNGVEVDRYGVPEGAVGYDTWALSAASGLITRTLGANDCRYLVEGENWLAVEVHQAKTDSSDLLFDLKLIAPATLIDYGAEWSYYDLGRLPPNRTVGTLGIIPDYAALPEKLLLYPNYPNPFNAETTIRYYLPQSEEVSVAIYDIRGRNIKTLVSGKQASGLYRINFEAGDLSTGIYLLRIVAGQAADTQKLLLLK